MGYTLIILLLPLASFALLGLFGNRLSHKTSGMVGTGSLLMVALLSFYAAGEYFTTQKAGAVFESLVPLNVLWLNMGANLHIDMGILLDPISVMMLVVISTVSLMVHIYSLGYMKGEKGFPALLRLPLSLYFLDVGIGVVYQYFSDVHLLGVGGRLLLPAHRLLLYKTDCRGGRKKSIYRDPLCRYVFPDRHPGTLLLYTNL